MTHHYERLHARQEYMTPGAAETVAIVSEVMAPGPGPLLAEVASGKGEAACTLASRHGCRVVGFDLYLPFLRLAGAKAAAMGLAGQVGFVRANGTRLPLSEERADGAYCIGAPSIVGLDACLAEIARVARPGSAVVVSDIAWRVLPDAPLGAEWGWVAEFEQVTGDAYSARIEAAGLQVERRHVHQRSTWDGYFGPMAEVAAEARAAGDEEFAEGIERGIEIEGRAADAYLDYVTFVARRA